MYDSLLQFLTSPLWKVPIYTFLDENCIIFDDEEENKFTYTDVHNVRPMQKLLIIQEFKKLIEGLVEGVMKELGINEDKFMEIMERGLKNPEHRKVFEQLLIVDNFLVFKKLMVKRNKELELEALRQLEEQERGKQGSPGVSETQYTQQSEELTEAERLQLEREQAEIEHAIALSLALEKERQKMLEAEEQALQEVIKLSEMEYKSQQEAEKLAQLQAIQEAERLKKLEEEEKKKKSAEKPKEEKPKEENKSNIDPTPITDSEMALMGLHQSQKKPVEEKKKVKETVFDMGTPEKEDYSHLPPLRMSTKFDNMDLGKLLEEKEKLDNKAEQIKKKEEKKEGKVDLDKAIESLEERKKRLKAQRELILAKKKAERQEELKKYNEEEKPLTLVHF